MAAFRKLKQEVRAWLLSARWQDELQRLDEHPAERCVGPLFSLLLESGELRWRAVTALGLTVARLAEENRERARVVMRRFIWNLCEESGNLGWGAPEAMGEVLAQHRGLACEYHRILVSYITETGRDDNFIEHLPLRRGAHWGVGRLAEVHPDLALPALEPCLQGLEHPRFAPPDLHEAPDATVRGLSAWTLGSLAGLPDLPQHRERLVTALGDRLQDHGELELFRAGELTVCSVAQLAREALERVEG